ncbi:hypothetical protein B0H34DRAFT_114916 [Crassisporium funariophilum]|nr:hypothetical protein B0H34DRAFT_114916 [Crassisporium funariophilum]
MDEDVLRNYPLSSSQRSIHHIKSYLIFSTMSMITSQSSLVTHASSGCTCTSCKCSNCTCGNPVSQASGGCGSTTCTCESNGSCSCKAGECKC